ncbi:uncharacterized protein LOC128235204 [Mya arenaria]|uniref:uncharacterized protein LOC128235204 n=1 Tax=Mya arenaria TaxID=6604 RepID=UPI0022E6C446|nr:uncharacterized protein LOC128235204 [Mya arenaria]XP_052805924.1 uncharacterized protein LOC128235204 [Mya arenaria]XP_052805925.1 uncharacterized protein LOC128235204 [Mya arenaria]
MASYKDILKEKENQNWLKGALTLRITKAGLRGLVEGDSCRLQQKIHSSVLQSRKLTAGTTCKLCLTENLLRCPTNGLCSHPRNCKYHDSPLKMPRCCPTQVCDDFRDKICAVHRYGGPSWKNTKADQWSTNHWQVTKCFMPPDGYKEVTSFKETDFNGIISVMINCSEFQRSLSFNISSKSTVLTKAREIGRNIRHSPDLKVTDTDLADYFATLNLLLTDSTFLVSDNDAQQAVLQLKQLEKGSLSISDEDVANAIIEVGKRELVESVAAGKKALEAVVSNGKTVIETGKRELAESVETGKKALECVASQGKTAIETGIREFTESVETGKKALEDPVRQGKNDIETCKRELAEIAETEKQEIEDMVSQGKIDIETCKRGLGEIAETEKQEIEDMVSQGKIYIETCKRELAEIAETEKQEIEGVVSQGKTDIETGKCEIDETLSKGKAVIETGTRRLEQKVSECQTALETGKRQLEDAMTTAKMRVKLEIENAVAKSRAVVLVEKPELEESLQLKKEVSSPSEAEQSEDLRQRLVKYYQKQLNSAPISPLLSDKDERLDRFYVPPKIVKKDHRRVGDDQQQSGSPISSYKQIFCNDEGLTGTVFVIGEAGMGKSSFSAMSTLKWATHVSVSIRDNGGKSLDQGEEKKNSSERRLLNDPLLKNVQGEYDKFLISLSYDDKFYVESNEEEFRKLLAKPMYDLLQDEDTLKSIEFMFHLNLRESCETCRLSDMIRDQLINTIYEPEERATGYSTMRRVLSNRKCVIIADGLDEWSHPFETKCSCSVEDKAIPHLSPMLDVTVIITSRPWRLSRNRVKDTKIGKYFEIQGIANTGLLVQKTLACLNERVAEKRTYLDFVQVVVRRKFAHLLSVPIKAMLLVCLLFEGIQESLSLCDIYAYMMEMMFARKELPMLRVSPESKSFLQCFMQKEHVQKYYIIVLKLAQLAFEKLFLSNRKTSLVFQKIDCLTQEELLFVLKSGILRETKSQSLIKKSSSFSFIHKTVQEFLAAVYVAHHPKEIQSVIKQYYHEAVQEYLAEDYSPLKYWSMKMPDVSQHFIYMCGLNNEVAHDMSAMMSNGILEHRNWNFDNGALDVNLEVQRTIVSGYTEAKANNVENIQLSLFYPYIDHGTSNISTVMALISMNRSQIRHIRIEGHQVEISEEDIQDVFNSSTDNLAIVEIWNHAGQYDLSACRHLQCLEIHGPETSNIVFNTKVLVSLELNHVSEKVESSVLQSLEQEWEKLEIFIICNLTNISFFCQKLPKLNHLKYLRIDEAILGNHSLLFPPSVTSVVLIRVTMSARSLRELVERVENCSHTVKCWLGRCTVEPITDFEDIKRHTETMKEFTIGDFEMCGPLTLFYKHKCLF